MRSSHSNGYNTARQGAEIPGVLLGFNCKTLDVQLARFLSKHYNSLRGMHVYCPKSSGTFHARLLPLHMIEEHRLDSPDYHRRVKKALRVAVVAARSARIVERKRRPRLQGKIPSAWQMVMQQEDTFIRYVGGGAIETNRRHH
jgi:hypothetical protein